MSRVWVLVVPMVCWGVLGCARPWGSLGPTGASCTVSVDEYMNYDMARELPQ